MSRSNKICVFVFIFVLHLSTNAQTRYHIVKPKENLFRLALNNNVSQEDIMRWNGMKTKTIFIGSRLIVWKDTNEKILIKKVVKSKSIKPKEFIEDAPGFQRPALDSFGRMDSIRNEAALRSELLRIKDSVKRNQAMIQIMSESHPNKQKQDLLNRAYFLYVNASFFVKLLINLVMIFLICIMLLVIFISMKRFRENQRNKIENHYRPIYQDQITEYLFDENCLDKVALKKQFRSNLLKDIFLSELLMLIRTLAGENKDRIKELYFELELDKFSLSKAKSSKWHEKTKGFSELAAFEVFEYKDLIFKHINDKNPIVAAEAEIALVQMLPDKPFDFMNRVEKDITPWEQLNILDLLKKRGIEPETLDECLSSENESVVQFAIKLIGIYKQTQHLHKLIPFLDSPNETTRGITIEALGMSNSEMFLEYLHKSYDKETYANKQRIITAMVYVQSDLNIEFLEKCLFEVDFNLSQNAARSLYFHGIDGVATLEKHKDNEQIAPIVAHVLDKRI